MALLTRLMRRFFGLAEHVGESSDGNVDMRADIRGRIALIEELERYGQEVHRLHSRIVGRFHVSPRPTAPPVASTVCAVSRKLTR